MSGRAGILFVMSAPSGTGKSTLSRRLLADDARLRFSVSFTTRQPREGERDGEHYHFLDRPAFEQKVESGGFLEWAEVYGNAYGTGRAETERLLDDGVDVLLDIDVQGAAQVLRSGLAAVSVLVLPPDYATLQARLADRGSEAPEVRERRLDEAAREAQQYEAFHYLVINDELERAAAELRAIVTAERARTDRRVAEARRIVDSLRERRDRRVT